MIETQSGPTQANHVGKWLRTMAVGRNPKTTLVRAAVLALVCVVVFKGALLPVRVEGISMTPTYANHSVNFVNRLSYLRHEPQRGDVVGIRLTPPNGSSPHIMYLKRIIGLPGEVISFVDGHPCINGQPLDEPYEKGACDWSMAPVTLSSDEFFVVGDNRSMPKEEHVLGKAERSRIVGQALW
jgi:signal peptidase I